MKRILIRLSALTAVVGLGAAAIVLAQRGTHPTAETAATTETETAPTPLDPYATTVAMPSQAGAAVDPFTAGQAAPSAPAEPGRYDLAPSQGIPPADEAMRRYGVAPAEGADPGQVQPAGYEADAAPAADEPLPLPTAAPARQRGEPTLAPPRPGHAVPDTPQPLDDASPLPAEPAPPADYRDQRLPDERPRGSATARSAGRSAGREPGLLRPVPEGEQPFDGNAAPDNFARPGRALDAIGSEGSGRPGHKQLEGPQSPNLVIEKVAPAEIQVGRAAVFAIKVRNVGGATASHVEVRDVLPKGTQLLSTTPRSTAGESGEIVWSLGAIKPGEEASVQLELMPIAEGEIGSVATVHFAAESSVRTLATKPVLALDFRGPREVLLGEEARFSIKLTNTGTGAADGVMLHDSLPEALEHPAGAELEYEVGQLKPGESRELELSMRAVKPGAISNVLTAHGEGNLRVDQRVDLEIVAPALEVRMEGPTRRYLDRQATYTVSVSNPGTATAKEISLVTRLPPGLKFVEANNAGQYDPQARAVHWLLDELPASETGSVTLVTVPVEVGEQLVRVEGTAERGLRAQEEKTIVVEGVSAIFFEVVDVDDPIEVGGEATYEVRVVNQGTKAATNLQVVVLLPEEMKPLSAEGPARYQIDGDRVLFDGLAQLAPKADTTYRVKAQGRGPGDVRIRVQILTDEMKTPVTKEESTRVYADE